MNIKLIEDKSLKRKISKKILERLPQWFGIPESTKEYIEESSSMPFWAVYDEDNYIGFIAVKITSKYTAEIYVIGVELEYHRKGIGTALFKECYNWCKINGYEFLQVKTLDESNPDIYYKKTRKFYKSLGFRELECFPTLWDESNPCLIMIMKI